MIKGSKMTAESKKKISESLKGNNYSLGFKHSKETINKWKNKIPWNKGLKNCYSKETIKKMKDSKKDYIPINKFSIKNYKNKYPTFSKIEEMRYNPNKPGEKEIQVHCKNHLCKNSKEQSGWFTPTRQQLIDRRVAIELGNGGNYFYCCGKCKDECPLYNLYSDPNKEIESPYTSSEYNLWRTTVLELDNHVCQYCEQPGNIAHHILPQKTHPQLSLDPENGICVCEKCHYKYGHKDDCSTGNLSKLICNEENNYEYT